MITFYDTLQFPEIRRKNPLQNATLKITHPPAPSSEGTQFSMSDKGESLITKQLSKAHTIREYKVLWAGLSSLWVRKWVREKAGEVWLRRPGWIIDCRSRFTAPRGRRLIFSHVIRSAGSPDGSLKQAANYFLMLQRTAHFKARELRSGQASGGLMTWDHQGCL